MTLRMQKTLRAVALVCFLAGPPSAFAIPFAVEITSSSYAAGLGTWSLTGPTSTADTWIVGFNDSYSGGADVVTGDYLWSLFGGGIGFGAISWGVFLDGQQIYAGSDGGFLAFYIGDSTQLSVVSNVASVPEPGTLLLIGTGLLGLAISPRLMRRQVRNS